MGCPKTVIKKTKNPLSGGGGSVRFLLGKNPWDIKGDMARFDSGGGGVIAGTRQRKKPQCGDAWEKGEDPDGAP